MEACGACSKTDREGEGKGEEKQRAPQEVEKVLAKGRRLSLRRRSKSAQESRVVVKDILQILFGIRAQVDLSPLYINWNLLKVINPFAVCASGSISPGKMGDRDFFLEK